MTAATMKKPSAKRYGVTNRMTFGRAIIYVLLTMMGFVMLYPMWYVLCVSFSNNVAMSGKGMIFWPVEFNLDAYRYVLGTPDLINIYGNTLGNKGLLPVDNKVLHSNILTVVHCHSLHLS